jgi:hypothetical protein
MSNNDLTELRRKVGMPTLDYAHPLHTFSSGNLTYTVSQDCYLVGCNVLAGNSVNVSIDGLTIGHSESSSSSQSDSQEFQHHLAIGQVVTVSAQASYLHILKPLD